MQVVTAKLMALVSLLACPLLPTLERRALVTRAVPKPISESTIMKRKSHFEIAAAVHETATLETMIAGSRGTGQPCY